MFFRMFLSFVFISIHDGLAIAIIFCLLLTRDFDVRHIFPFGFQRTKSYKNYATIN